MLVTNCDSCVWTFITLIWSYFDALAGCYAFYVGLVCRVLLTDIVELAWCVSLLSWA